MSRIVCHLLKLTVSAANVQIVLECMEKDIGTNFVDGHKEGLHMGGLKQPNLLLSQL